MGDEPLGVLGAGSAAGEEATFAALRTRLLVLTADPTTREGDGASRYMIKVEGSRTTKWKYIQQIMQVCADPEIRIYKIHFRVARPQPKPPSAEAPTPK